MAIKKTIEIDVNTSDAVNGIDKLNKSIKETNKDVKQTSETTSVLGSELDKATNGAIGKFKGLVSVVKTTIKGFKGLQVAIAATGLGLLLITLASLKAAFTGSEEGQNKFAKLMGVIGAVTGNVIDLLADLGDLIIKTFTEPKKVISDLGQTIKTYVIDNVNGVLDGLGLLGEALKKAFSGDFKGALKDAGEGMGKIVYATNPAIQAINGLAKATSNFTKEQIREGKLAAVVADKRAKADKLERELIVGRAEAERKIADLREKAAQKDKFNASERKQFLLEASKVNEDITNKEIEASKLRRDAIKLENTLSRSNKDDLKAEEEAKAKVIQLETARLKLQKSLSAEISAVNAQQSAENKAKLKEQEDRTNKEKEQNEKRLQSIADLKKKFLDADADNDAKTREEKLELERSRAEQDLENLKGTEAEKREAKIALDAFYDQREAELKAERDAEAEEKRKKKQEQEIEDAQTLSEQKIQLQNATVNNLQKIFGQETAIGKALLIAKQAIAAQELILQIKSDIAAAKSSATKATLKASEAGVDIASGAAKTLGAAPFPANIPLIVGYAASAVGIATSISSALKKVKGAKGDISTTPSGGGASAPPPAFNLVGGSNVNEIGDTLNQEQTPIQAYVVGSEVTNQQEIDNAQASSASIG